MLTATVLVSGKPVSVTIEYDRPDGGLTVRSDDVPGFLLSHFHPGLVLSDVIPALDAILNSPAEINDIGLSYRCLARLKARGIATIDRLRRMTDSDLRAIPGFGRKCVNEVRHYAGPHIQVKD